MAERNKPNAGAEKSTTTPDPEEQAELKRQMQQDLDEGGNADVAAQNERVMAQNQQMSQIAADQERESLEGRLNMQERHATADIDLTVARFQPNPERPQGMGPNAVGKPGAGGSPDGGTNQGTAFGLSPTLHDRRSGIANADGEVLGAVVEDKFGARVEAAEYDSTDPSAQIPCPNPNCRLTLFPFGHQGKTLVCACGCEVPL